MRGRHAVLLAAAWLSACAAAPFAVDRPGLQAEVARLRARHPGVRIAYWLGGADGAPAAALDAREPLATASAIKVAYLVELFAAHAGRLDAPLPGTDLLEDPAHPAVAHFDEGTQAEIVDALVGATCREVGWAMIRSRLGPDGPRVSNAVYNAAANVTTAVLGGPAGLTERIGARWPGARDLRVRRYMLAARDVTGDNTATAAGLATVFAGIAAGRIAGVDAATLEAIRATLDVGDEPPWGVHHFKGGSLDSAPPCRILAGFYAPSAATSASASPGEPSSGSLRVPRAPIVYAVMVEGAGSAAGVGDRLAALARELRSALLDAVQTEESRSRVPQ